MIKRFTAAAIVATLGLGTGAYAFAAESPGHSTSPTTSAAGATNAGHPNGGRGGKRADLDQLIRKADHGSLDVKGQDGTFSTVTFDRGNVDAASPTSITLTRPDGQHVTKAITADTTYHGIDGAAAIQVGKPALVVSKGDAATVVAQRDPAHPNQSKNRVGPAGTNNAPIQ